MYALAVSLFADIIHNLHLMSCTFQMNALIMLCTTYTWQRPIPIFDQTGTSIGPDQYHTAYQNVHQSTRGQQNDNCMLDRVLPFYVVQLVICICILWYTHKARRQCTHQFYFEYTSCCASIPPVFNIPASILVSMPANCYC